MAWCCISSSLIRKVAGTNESYTVLSTLAGWDNRDELVEAHLREG